MVVGDVQAAGVVVAAQQEHALAPGSFVLLEASHHRGTRS